MKSTADELVLRLKERGCQSRIVSARHVRDLQEAIQGTHERGLLDDDFYRERLSWFTFQPPDSLPDAKSLIVVAVPRPQARVVFTWNGKARPLVLPPTYMGYEVTRQQVEDWVTSVLAPAGFHVARTGLPQKLLAVRSGLGQYGRNNICYVPGMGSFHQLTAVYSDLPCSEDSWQEAQMLPGCQNCHACIRRCPTGAIPTDRFLLHAERCLVFHNERPASMPFPAWIEPGWHNCLMGCMICQQVCPQDKDWIAWVEEGAEFSEQETTLLLRGAALEQLSSATAEKLKRLELLDSLDILPRNLSVLLNEN